MTNEELAAEAKRKEEEKKRKNIEKNDSNHIITEDGTLGAFGFNDNYSANN